MEGEILEGRDVLIDQLEELPPAARGKRYPIDPALQSRLRTEDSMQAIELEATIDAQHHIHVEVPESVPPGRARVILLFEPATEPAKERLFGRFRGQGQVPANFDEALPDEFWTGDTR